MSIDVERQLEGYAADVVARSEPVDIASLVRADAESTDGEAGASVLADYRDERKGSRMREGQSRRWWGIAAAAAAVLLVVGAVVAANSSEDDPASTITDEAPVPPGPDGPETTGKVPPSMGTVQGALLATDAYFEAFGQGDLDGVLAYFIPGATFQDTAGFDDRAGFETFTAWDMAKGSIRRSLDCGESEDRSGLAVGEIRIDCTYDDDTYLAQVADGPTVPVTVRLTFIADGITSYASIFGLPDYNTMNIPFDEWMAENHSAESADTGCCAGDTVDESQRRGALRMEFADEWAAYLAANGCTYGEPC